jgi:Fe-S cluster biogenesis protein NfuA
MVQQTNLSVLLFCLLGCTGSWGFVVAPYGKPPSIFQSNRHQQQQPSAGNIPLFLTSKVESNMDAGSNSTSTPSVAASSSAPVLNGKRVLPLKIMMAGLSGHKIAASYAIFSNDYKTAEWKACQHVGITRDLEETLQTHSKDHGDQVSFVRALSFIIPNEGAMESIAVDWRKEAVQAGGKTNFDPILAAMEQDFDPDDEDLDDDDDDDYFEMMAAAISASRTDLASARGIKEPEIKKEETVVSPFAVYSSTTEERSLVFSKANVDKVLEEIRPYLISDGGNVSVERVDETTRNVYLKLEGACGSCPSSTVTMQMGIERVLKENFADLGQVLRVEEEETKSTELTYQAVEQEVNRIKPAIIAMGGLVEILSVDPKGVVELKFRGASKVKTGLELALLDVEFVEHVKFVMDE